MVKEIISICEGGLGNRLLPLFDAIELSERTNVSLSVCWRHASRCGSDFGELFDGKYTNLNWSDFNALTGWTIYSNGDAADYECEAHNNCHLIEFFKNNTVVSISELNPDNLPDKTCIFANKSLGIADKSRYGYYFDKLMLTTDINERVRHEITRLNIKTTTVGVHLRCTDFGKTVTDYFPQVQSLVHRFPNTNIFVCSDDPAAEQFMKANIPNVVIRDRKVSVSRLNPANLNWNNNVDTPLDAVIDGLIDLLCLANTNFQVYNPQSSFAELILGLKN